MAKTARKRSKQPQSVPKGSRRPVRPKWLKVGPREYHDVDLLSHSKLKLFAEDPEAYRAIYVEKTQLPPQGSPSMQFGTDVENWLFYGTLPGVAIMPDDMDRKSKAFRELKMANVGKKLMTQEEASRDERFAKYFEIAENVQAHTLANMLMYDGALIHQAIQWTDMGIVRKCQLDLFAEDDFIADLKTAKAIDKDTWESDAERWGYGMQAATYQDAVHALTGKRLPFFFIVVKNTPSYGVEVFEADEDMLGIGRQTYKKHLRRFRECCESGIWRSATFGSAVRVSAPWWRKSAPVFIKLKGKSVRVS